MRKYTKPDMRITFIKNDDIINAGTSITAVNLLGTELTKKGIKYKMVNFK